MDPAEFRYDPELTKTRLLGLSDPNTSILTDRQTDDTYLDHR